MHEYRLRVGRAVIGLRFRREGERHAFEKYFRRPSHPGAADVSLALRFEDRVRGLSTIPNSLFLTKRGGGDGFSVADGLVRGRYSPASGEGELIIQRIILEGNFARIFEQVLYQACWSAFRRSGIEALLLHSSGIARNGKGYIFTGRSGSGKSTVTTLSPGGKILNDEITLVDLSGDAPTLMDTPFNGQFEAKEEGSAPLAATLLLRQAPYHRATLVQDAESVKTLSKEVIPPMGLETPLSDRVYWDMLGLAQRLSKSAPLYLLEFMPDPGFWTCIEEGEVIVS